MYYLVSATWVEWTEVPVYLTNDYEDAYEMARGVARNKFIRRAIIRKREMTEAETRQIWEQIGRIAGKSDVPPQSDLVPSFWRDDYLKGFYRTRGRKKAA